MAYPLPADVPFIEQPEDILLAQLVLGEAANQPENARLAVAWSAFNRLLYYRREYGPRTWAGVILRPGQYDCFTDLKAKLRNPLMHESAATWDECYAVAEAILRHTVPDMTDKSTHYFDRSLDGGREPKWSKSPLMEHVCDIGDFHFYRYKP